ncbi:hypothetical protein K6119_02115 [Paracrocinitomix mangrovi]|uniref:DUF7793 family protein n=1 Tax=Paracrocinitomix mangrovi TaxID=2862509 RepID=UPI001C8DAFC6|nr:hypothetical protein [Paracrocinitomix mangrovi]UKN02314.1 hypothetical protein K6119_02115 [Paracrocinitomix mangrovi]
MATTSHLKRGNVSKETRTTNAYIQLIDEEIFYVLYKTDITIEISDFEETRAVYLKWSEDKPLKFLVEFPTYTTATAAARKWAEDHQVDCIAEAIVFYGLPQRLLIRFYLLFRKQNHPSKIFTYREDAVNWLKTYDLHQ